MAAFYPIRPTVVVASFVRPVPVGRVIHVVPPPPSPPASPPGLLHTPLRYDMTFLRAANARRTLFLGRMPLAPTEFVNPDPIPSAEAFGTVVVSEYVVLPDPIPSAEAFGTVAVSQYGIFPDPIPSAEVFGTLKMVSIIRADSALSGEAFGTVLVQYADIRPDPIPTGLTFGTVTVQENRAAPDSILSEEAFGTVTVRDMTIVPDPIPSAEVFGVVAVVERAFFPLGIQSGEAFGNISIRYGPKPDSIPSAEAFGNLRIQENRLLPPSIVSGTVFGNVTVREGGWLYRLLPAVIRLRDRIASGGVSSVGVLQRVIAAAENEVDAWADAVNGLSELQDVFECPAEWLPYLAESVGLELERSLPDPQKREQLRSYVRLLRMKGTHVGFGGLARGVGIRNGVRLVELVKADLAEASGNYAEPPGTQPAGSRPYPVAHPYKSARVAVYDDLHTAGYEPVDGAAILRRIGAVPVHVTTPLRVYPRLVDESASAAFEDFAVGASIDITDEAAAALDEVAGPDGSCVKACEISACQTGEEVCCNKNCELTSCQTSGCQAFCEIGACQNFQQYNACTNTCESSCQRECENSCQKMCERHCQLNCEYSCQSGCETGCQGDEQACRQTCQSTIQLGCT